MNQEILDKYGIVMSVGKFENASKGFAHIEGNLTGYIYAYQYPEDVQDLIDDINLALNGKFSEIEDPDYGGGIDGISMPYYFAEIKPTSFEIFHNSEEFEQRQIIPLEDWKEILLSWKFCLEKAKTL